MMVRLFSSLLLCFCAACASEKPPQPDPGAMELLLARLETCPTQCQPGGEKWEESEGSSPASLPENFQNKIESADRIFSAIERIPADKIDPSVAAALVTR